MGFLFVFDRFPLNQDGDPINAKLASVQVGVVGFEFFADKTVEDRKNRIDLKLSRLKFLLDAVLLRKCRELSVNYWIHLDFPQSML